MNELVRTVDDRPRVGAGPIDPLPQPATPATVIRDAAEAIAAAHAFAAAVAPGAGERDAEWLLPIAEVEQFSQAGLWNLNIPAAYGGPGLSYATIAEVVAIVSAADPSLGQLPQSHLSIANQISLSGTEEQRRHFFAAFLGGQRLGNAVSEKGSRTVADFTTRLIPDGDGFRLVGRKFYATGALLAHLIAVAAKDGEGRTHLAIVPRDAIGLGVANDWSAFGQRTTASGTVVLDDVFVPASQVVPVWRSYARPTSAGPVSQILQAAIDAGIARGAIAETIAFVRTRARPWLDSGKETAAEDPFTIAAVGDLMIRLHAAEAVLARAGRAVDRAVAEPDERVVAEASIAVAEAKVLTADIALTASSRLHELGGTRTALAADALDRYWRNARVHTLHDPVRWKYFHIGNWRLNGIAPPRHTWS